MTRRALAGVIVALASALGLAAAPPAAAGDRPAIVVTQPGGGAYRIAIQQFAEKGPVVDAAQPPRLREEIAKALEFSGFFQSLDPKAFLGPKKTTDLDSGPPVVCSDWRQGGADALLQGEVTATPRSLTIEFRVWDLARCVKLLRKRYRGGPQDELGMARRLADDVVGAFTGTRGVSSTQIAFVSTRSGAPEIWVMDAPGTNAHQITRNRSINAFPDWSPDAQSLLYMSYRYRRSPHIFLLHRGWRAPRLLLRDLGVRAQEYRGVFDPSGRRIAVVLSIHGESNLYVVDANGRNLRQLTHDSAIDVSPTWSPDGKRIAFVSDRGGSPQIYVMNADGSDPQRLTYDGSYNTAPSWSPDGRWIAYEARVGGQFDIWLIDPSGQTNVPLVTNPRSDENPSWSPDGRKIAFQSTRRGPADIYVIDVNGHHLLRLTHGEGQNRDPAWGPFPR